MAEPPGESREYEFIDAAQERAERAVRLMRNLGQGISFGLVDVDLLPEGPDDETRARLASLAGVLSELADINRDLADRVTAVAETGKESEESQDTTTPPPIVHSSDTPDLPAAPAPQPEEDTSETPEEPAPEPPPPDPEENKEDEVKPPCGEELYTGFVDRKWVPDRPPVEDSKAVKVVLKQPFTLQKGDQTVELVGHEVCLFNCCLLLRGQESISIDDILDLGFSPGSPNTEIAKGELFGARKSLMEKLDQAFGKNHNILGGQYRIKANVVFTWSEEPEPDIAKANGHGSSAPRVKKN